ncbi:MAG: hypothetical protein E7672_01220 [Ruminococcaceae bacterium]|nr:hypothetical protein [Oscillospiraceae bacterium]
MEDKKNFSDKINNMISKATDETSGGTNVSISITVDSNSGGKRTYNTGERASDSNDGGSGDNFWDLGQPRQKKYAPPTFEGHTIDTTDIEDSGESYTYHAKSEKIPPRQSSQQSSPKVVNTVDGPRYATGSYKGHSAHSRIRRDFATKKRVPSKEVLTYSPNNTLVRKIEVKTWETDVEFYGRFASDAKSSHFAEPSIPYTEAITPVVYNSYVPQYSHMSRQQIEYYRWLRENIRHGIFPECDAAYILLYIYEIINLPEVIPAAEGASLLAKVWLGYRKAYPRIDGYLCEWMADYCMINAIPIPEEILSIRHEIAPKAQFKEFYLDMAQSPTEEELIGTAKAMIEVSSDYDYKTSRYYPDHRDDYELHIPRALSRVLEGSHKNGSTILSLDRVYKMTRDTYCGAIVSSGIKRRLDIEFVSFTRRADSREAVTHLVKYAENKVRSVVGVKAKLGCDKADPTGVAIIDRYFAPLIPEKAKKSSADEYMPVDYLKNYESDDSGFDLSTAMAIEKESWANTARLTGEDFDIPRVTAELSEEYEESPSVDGEIGFDSDELPMIEDYEDSDNGDICGESENISAAEDGDDIRDALTSALSGSFKEYCRARNLHEGEIADRINNIFLDEIGDILLENIGGKYVLIEDYRGDAENWLTV